MQIYTLTNPLSQEYVRQIPREEWMVNEAWQPGERYFAPRLPNPKNRSTRRRFRK